MRGDHDQNVGAPSSEEPHEETGVGSRSLEGERELRLVDEDVAPWPPERLVDHLELDVARSQSGDDDSTSRVVVEGPRYEHSEHYRRSLFVSMSNHIANRVKSTENVSISATRIAVPAFGGCPE